MPKEMTEQQQQAIDNVVAAHYYDEPQDLVLETLGENPEMLDDLYIAIKDGDKKKVGELVFNCLTKELTKSADLRIENNPWEFVEEVLTKEEARAEEQRDMERLSAWRI